MSRTYDARRVINGTFGEAWLSGEKVGEVIGLQAKQKFNKEKVFIGEQLEQDSKITSIEGTGSLKMNKVNSRMAIVLGELVSQGKDPWFTIISKLKDPDSYGAERVALYNVSFDELTVADWEKGKVGQVESPFTFTKREYLDLIEA